MIREILFFLNHKALKIIVMLKKALTSDTTQLLIILLDFFFCLKEKLLFSLFCTINAGTINTAVANCKQASQSRGLIKTNEGYNNAIYKSFHQNYKTFRTNQSLSLHISDVRTQGLYCEQINFNALFFDTKSSKLTKYSTPFKSITHFCITCMGSDFMHCCAYSTNCIYCRLLAILQPFLQ